MFLGPVSLIFLGVVVIASLVLLYLAQSSRLVVRGYDLATLERQRELVELENEKLELQAAELQSITAIQKSSLTEKLETVKRINYVPSVSTVAVR